MFDGGFAEGWTSVQQPDCRIHVSLNGLLEAPTPPKSTACCFGAMYANAAKARAGGDVVPEHAPDGLGAGEETDEGDESVGVGLMATEPSATRPHPVISTTASSVARRMR